MHIQELTPPPNEGFLALSLLPPLKAFSRSAIPEGIFLISGASQPSSSTAALCAAAHIPSLVILLPSAPHPSDKTT
jgi:hypothetical protein